MNRGESLALGWDDWKNFGIFKHKLRVHNMFKSEIYTYFKREREREKKEKKN